MDDMDDLDFLERCGTDLDNALNRIDLGNSLTAALQACAEIQVKMPSLNGLIESVELLQKHVKPTAGSLKTLGEQLETLGADLESAETAEDLNLVAREVKRFQGQLSVLFRSVIDIIDNFERLEVKPLEPLAKIFSDEKRKIIAQDIQKIREEFKNFERHPVNFPVSISRIQDLIKDIFSEIKLVTGNTEMSDFLLKFARDGGVSLSLVSPEVLEWLRGNDMLQNFRVVSN